MTLPGETLGFTGAYCPCCCARLELQVLRSAAGYYLGYLCLEDGPVSRESYYYSNREDAEADLTRAKDGYEILNPRY